jgi:hypothetical protein
MNTSNYARSVAAHSRQNNPDVEWSSSLTCRDISRDPELLADKPFFEHGFPPCLIDFVLRKSSNWSVIVPELYQGRVMVGGGLTRSAISAPGSPPPKNKARIAAVRAGVAPDLH